MRIDRAHPSLSIGRQCKLLGLARSSLYYQPVALSDEDDLLMRLLDEQFTRTPFYGVRRMTAWLHSQGQEVNLKRVRRLLRTMGLEAVYPKPRLSNPDHRNRRFPYLLRGVAITRPDQVWSTDITYIRLRRGYVYLTAVMDWYSRFVLTWRLSPSLEADFCLEALEEALASGHCPEIFNTDQGAQFTCEAFVGRLEQARIRISMDGRGRALDNVFVERLWRSVKYEEVYVKDYETVRDARQGLSDYFAFYNHERFHQALDYRTPMVVYREPRGEGAPRAASRIGKEA